MFPGFFFSNKNHRKIWVFEVKTPLDFLCKNSGVSHMKSQQKLGQYKVGPYDRYKWSNRKIAPENRESEPQNERIVFQLIFRFHVGFGGSFFEASWKTSQTAKVSEKNK